MSASSARRTSSGNATCGTFCRSDAACVARRTTPVGGADERGERQVGGEREKRSARSPLLPGRGGLVGAGEEEHGHLEDQPWLATEELPQMLLRVLKVVRHARRSLVAVGLAMDLHALLLLNLFALTLALTLALAVALLALGLILALCRVATTATVRLGPNAALCLPRLPLLPFVLLSRVPAARGRLAEFAAPAVVVRSAMLLHDCRHAVRSVHLVPANHTTSDGGHAA